ncbi:F-box/WD repeat-containing protein 7-like [Cyprinodon tularosa]|uniref:F-box/WD repeat-containing protein 7-like n=1 Tax=Cyprinodon tularosa TaxID=77115 RepID=UPI0018E21129|nr:F-box/WD repeat-containing protein 7-like [Cyprinodon tularosa]
MGFYGTLKLIFYKMKRKLDHGPDGRPFPSGKKHCKGNGYLSPSSLAQATPTTFGDLRLANGHSAQRRRVNSGPPPSGLQDWLLTFQTWSGPERLLALDELIDRCETSQVKHMMQVIEPQFQRDFISLLPKELALYVLTFLAPSDLLQAAQTCRYWRILAEDNLLWREKCREEGISDRMPYHRRDCVHPDASFSPWKSAYIRQHRIETNWRKGDRREPMVLKGHDDHVITCLQFSGDLIVSGSDDNTLKVWSAITGKCLRTLTGHTGGVWCSQMTGTTVISGSTDRTLRVWDAESGECVHALYGHTSTVRCMHLHGNRIVSGSRDTTLRMWDVSTGQCEHVLTGHVAAVRCVQYDGRRVVSGGYDYMVKVWDPEAEVCLHTLQGHTNRVYSLQFDGVFVVSGSLDTSIRVWDVETGACVHTLTGHQSLTSGMELRDNILVSGNADSTVRVWDVRTGQCLHTLQGPNKHQSAVTCLQFCRGLVLSSSDDGTVKLWDLRTGAWLRDVVALQSRGSGGVVWRIRASDTRLVCAAGSRNGTEETKLLVLDFDLEDRKKDTDLK